MAVASDTSSNVFGKLNMNVLHVLIAGSYLKLWHVCAVYVSTYTLLKRPWVRKCPWQNGYIT